MSVASTSAKVSPMHFRGPAPKGKYACDVPLRAEAAFGEALGVEALGVLPEVGVALRGVGRQKRERAGLEGVRADAQRRLDAARDEPHGRREAQRLAEHHARVREARIVVGGGGAVAEHGVELRVERSADLRRAREPRPRPREEVGGGLVSGAEDGDHLVAELLVGHGLAGLFVARLDEHAEKLSARRVGVRRRASWRWRRRRRGPRCRAPRESACFAAWATTRGAATAARSAR